MGRRGIDIFAPCQGRKIRATQPAKFQCGTTSSMRCVDGLTIGDVRVEARCIGDRIAIVDLVCHTDREGNDFGYETLELSGRKARVEHDEDRGLIGCLHRARKGARGDDHAIMWRVCFVLELDGVFIAVAGEMDDGLFGIKGVARV